MIGRVVHITRDIRDTATEELSSSFFTSPGKSRTLNHCLHIDSLLYSLGNLQRTIRAFAGIVPTIVIHRMLCAVNRVIDWKVRFKFYYRDRLRSIGERSRIPIVDRTAPCERPNGNQMKTIATDMCSQVRRRVLQSYLEMPVAILDDEFHNRLLLDMMDLAAFDFLIGNVFRCFVLSHTLTFSQATWTAII